jgi:iron complex outermembrane recepter protein
MKMQRCLVSRLLAPILCFLALVRAGAGYAAEPTHHFAIPGEDLAIALEDFGRQSGDEILFNRDDVRGKAAHSVSGDFSSDDALAKLLAGSGLSVRKANPHTFVVEPAPRPPGAANDQNFSVPPPSSATSTAASLEEIVVTGTHIAGVGPVGSSLTIYTRSDIDQSGAASIDQFARQMTGNFSNVDTVANITSNARFAPFSDSTNANSFAGSAFNLHGLGATATLTLLNGHRLATAGSDGSFTDISQIPLSAIDHIEVLSDGASAIYGADAVAGVVNIITRKDFDGAETAVRYGAATEGGAIERSVSQLLGHSWGTGNAILNYEYDDQAGLDASQRSYIPNLGGPYSLIPESHRNSILLSGTQSLDDATTLSGEALYSDRAFLGVDTMDNPFIDEGDLNTGHAKQSSIALELERVLFKDWTFRLSGNYSDMRQSLESTSVLTGAFSADIASSMEADSKLSALDAVVSGSVAHLPGGDMKVSVGGEFRSERFGSNTDIDFSGQASSSTVPNLQRHVRSAYAEGFIPVIGQDNALPGARRLEISAAGRFDDYSDFGSTINPKLGLMWEPVSGFELRGSYGTSFRAPLLSQLGSTQTLNTSSVADPAASAGVTDTIVVGGGNPALKPEKSTSFTGGFDLRPIELPGADLSMTFFHIHFTDRVATPPTSTGGAIELTDPALAPFVIRNPSPSQILGYFNTPGFIDETGMGPGAVQAILLNQYANVGTSIESGVDLSAKYAFPVGPGKVNFSLAVERLLKNEFQTVSTLPFIAALNTFGEPPKWKGRAGAGWTQEHFAASLFVNYVNSYQNLLFTPPQGVGSFATADLFLSYKSGEAPPMYLARNLTISLSINNIADKKPPYVQIPGVDLSGGTPIPFDPTNASPVGRLITLSVIKHW